MTLGRQVSRGLFMPRCQYDGMEQFLAGVTGFVEAGLEQDEPVLAALHGRHAEPAPRAAGRPGPGGELG